MKKKASIGEKVFDCFNIFLMLLIVFVTLYPFWYVAIISLNDGMDAGRGGVYFLPRVFTLQNYQVVFQNPNLVRAFMVTLVRTVVGTFMSVLFTSFMAYALTHKHLLFRRFYIIIGIITMFFSAGLIPYYLTIRNLGLRNSFWVYIFPALFNFYNCIIMRAFFMQLPDGLEESAKIEGAGYWRIFISLILPLSGPVLATMSLFFGVYHWNDYFTPLLYVDRIELLPIQTILYRIVAEAESTTMITQVVLPDASLKRRITSDAVKMATMMVTTVPIICVYPFLQKYFMKGMLIGSIKG